MPLFKPREKEDITIEFYHKTAVYCSKITGGKTLIDIARVWKIKIRSGLYQTVIISDKGVHYALEELILPS